MKKVFVTILILRMRGKEKPPFVFDHPAEVVPTVSKLIMIAEPVLVDIAPKAVIKIVANCVEQFAVVIIRKIDKIRYQICRVVGVAWMIPLIFAVPGHTAFVRVAVFASNSFLDKFGYLSNECRHRLVP